MKDYTPFRKRLGQLLAEKRKQKQITQKEMAARLYIERSAVSKIEHGDYNLLLFRVMDYCRKAGFTFSELMQEFEEKK